MTYDIKTFGILPISHGIDYSGWNIRTSIKYDRPLIDVDLVVKKNLEK